MKKEYVAGGGNEMYNLNWSRSDLTRQKLGTFCEYYAKMSLASYGVSIYCELPSRVTLADFQTTKKLANPHKY